MNRPIVLVHGAFHGSWCWDRVTPHLDAAEVTWVAPDLPSCAKAATGALLKDDVAAVREVLDSLPGDEHAVMLGHSRGGAVITEAGVHGAGWREVPCYHEWGIRSLEFPLEPWT